MDYRQVIAQSWRSTQSSKSVIIWFGFVPALFTTTFGVGYMAYQFFSFKKSYLFDDSEESFIHDVIAYGWDFMKDHVNWTVPLIIFAIIFAISYFVLPTLAKASAIQAIARQRNGQATGVGIGLRYGIMSFLKLIEYHLLIKTFSFFSILTEISFVLRNLGLSLFGVLLPFFILFAFLSLLLTLLFTYSDLFIVIDDDGVFESMKKSAKLVIMNWKHTFLISLLMLMIGVRIIIQALLVFLIPAVIILIAGLLATVTLPITGIIVGGVLGAIGLILASYLNGIVDVFSYTVWTLTFLELSSERETSAREAFSDDIGLNKAPEAPEHKNLEQSEPDRSE